MKKLFLRAEFGPLWEPWEEDEVGRKEFAFSCQAKTHILFTLERTQAFLQSGVRPIFVCAHARIHKLFKCMEIRYSLKIF